MNGFWKKYGEGRSMVWSTLGSRMTEVKSKVMDVRSSSCSIPRVGRRIALVRGSTWVIIGDSIC